MSYVRRSRFVAGTLDWTTELSARPWTPADFTIGGSRTSAAGIAASYVVRRDALVRLPLRVSEDEWVSLLALVKYGQTSQSFTWYPDADYTDAIQVVLESPLAGEAWEPSRMGEFLRVFEFTLTLRAVPSLTPSVDPYREYFAEAVPGVPSDTVIDSVSVQPGVIPALPVGSTQLLEGQAFNVSLQTVPGAVVTWASDDPTVATVSADITSDGITHNASVTGLDVGSTVIRAYANGVPATVVTVTVTAAPSGTLYWDDDQAGGVFGGATGGYGWSNFAGGFYNPAPSVVADADSPTGYAVRFRYNPSPQGSLSEARIVFGANLTEVYIGWSAKYPLNYYHRNGPSSDNNKMLRLWGNDYSTPEPGPKTGFSTLPSPSTGGGSFFVFNHETMGVNSGNGRTYQDWHPTGVTGIRLASDLGMYKRWVFHGKVASGPGANDGVVELWIDGVVIWSKSDADLWDYSAVAHNYFDHMYLLGAANSGFNVVTDILVQGVKLGATYSDVA